MASDILRRPLMAPPNLVEPVNHTPRFRGTPDESLRTSSGIIRLLTQASVSISIESAVILL
ncbi:hypothetical protein MTBLM5_660003 [Magnetospirillum sp. LM-5]|nr:hypothetical protein MTBLM5_660003 [Magnetospirillum sp. LM-5]